MRKLIVPIVMIVLFINFSFFWLSIWPYAKPVVMSGGKYVANSDVIKTNFIKYLFLSVLTMIIGIICYLKSKNLNSKKI